MATQVLLVVKTSQLTSFSPLMVLYNLPVEESHITPSNDKAISALSAALPQNGLNSICIIWVDFWTDVVDLVQKKSHHAFHVLTVVISEIPDLCCSLFIYFC
uniref:Uncharacterized protein n=1 Tax=Sphaerodactylus townsendi TaxID=933632 RepID=A0ACB8F3P0_9SAUR